MSSMKRLQRPVFALVMVLVTVAALRGQQDLPRPIPNLAAPALRHAEPLNRMFRLGRPISVIGGVQFETTAVPRIGTKVDSLRIDYLPDAADGSRLSLVINETAVKTRLSDWQLIPIARFADSEWLACVTLFGGLTESRWDEHFKRQGHQIINYHPAFKDTLLGWRLAFLDMLILDARCAREYYRSSEEPRTNPQAAQRAFDVITPILHRRNEQVFQSYFVCDWERTVEFFVSRSTSSLGFRGEPVFCLVKENREGRPGVPADSARFVRAESERLSSKTSELRRINPAVWDAGVNTMQYAAFFRFCKQK